MRKMCLGIVSIAFLQTTLLAQSHVKINFKAESEQFNTATDVITTLRPVKSLPFADHFVEPRTTSGALVINGRVARYQLHHCHL